MPMFRLMPILLAAALLAAGGCASTAQTGQITRLTPEDLARLTPLPNPKVPLSEVIALSKAGTPPNP